MSSTSRTRLFGFRLAPRTRTDQARRLRRLAFQPLESRRLLAVVGDWAVLDLRSQLSDATYSFLDLSGVAFHGNQLAVTANVQATAGDKEGRLLLVDYDLDAHTAEIVRNLTVPSLGGATQTLAVNSNGTQIYVTGFSDSPAAPSLGEAFRAVWDGSVIATQPLGSIPGLDSPTPVFQSVGVGVTTGGVVTGTSDQGQAIFEYDQSMVRAGEIARGLVYGISEDRVKVGMDGVEGLVASFIWEADGTRRVLQDPSGNGAFAFGISPDHGVIVGSGILGGSGGSSFEKAFWWDYDTATVHIVSDATDVPIDGRLTSATNADVGYLVGQSEPTSPTPAGDLIHNLATNETEKIVDWFERYSAVSVPAETSGWGPEVVYDDGTGTLAIISGGHLFAVKIQEDNLPPVAVDDTFTTPTNVPLVVSAPGVLGNDTDDGAGALTALLVAGPLHGLLDLRGDGSFTYTPDAGFNREDAFTYRATDGSGESNLGTVHITIETEFPWHNGLSPRDVNDDGYISPIDALQIINALNRREGGPLPTVPPRPRPLTRPFYDVAPDNELAPRDAIWVINYLNSRGGTGATGGAAEGEPLADAVTGSGFARAEPLGWVGAARAALVAGGTAAAAETVWAGDVEAGGRQAVEIGWAVTGRSAARNPMGSADDLWGTGELEDLLTQLCGGATGP